MWRKRPKPLVPNSPPSSAALIIALEQVVAVALAVATLHDVESKKAVVWP